MKYRKIDVVRQDLTSSQNLVVIARREDGQKFEIKVENLPSYFFLPIKPEYPPNLLAKVKSIEGGYKSIYGKELWKITTWKSQDTNLLRKGYDHHEADILWTERACIDLKLTDGFRYENNQIIPDNDVDHIKLRTWVLDIEVITPPSVFASYENPKYQTACIVFYDSYDKRIFTLSTKYVDEKTMFEELFQLLEEKKPDIITGWNISFDISWLLKRAEALKLDPRRFSPIKHYIAPREYQRMHGFKIVIAEIPGIIVFDGLEAYKIKKNPSGQLSSYNLHSVAEKELDNLQWEDLGSRIEESWKKNPQDVIDYCKQDVDVERQIIFKENLIDQSLTLCRLSGCTLPQTTKKEQIIDHAILLRRGNRILPSKKRSILKDQGIDYLPEEVKVKGAVVLKPSPGIHYNIGVFDAAALYPSIIVGFNISPEVKDVNGSIKIHTEWDEEKKNNLTGKKEILHVVKDFAFKNPKEQIGIIPEAIKEFRELREQVRERKRLAEEQYGHDSPQFKALEEEDTADKFIITSFYGVNGFAGFRLYDPDCANAITAVGRQFIEGLVPYLGKRGFPVEYGDTDSVFVKLNTVNDGDTVSKLISEFLTEKLRSMGVNEGAIQVKFEKFFEWCIFKQREIRKGVYEPVKKKYVAHMTWTEGLGGKMEPTDYMYIRGFETRRSDSSPILKDTMKQFFNYMQKNQFDEAIKVLKKVKKNWNNYSPIDIAIPKKITTLNPKTDNPWIRGITYGKQLGWRYDDQSAVQLLYLSYSGGKNMDVICLQKHHSLPSDFKIDYNMMFEKVIQNKFEDLIDAMGKDWKIDIEGLKTLEGWF